MTLKSHSSILMHGPNPFAIALALEFKAFFLKLCTLSPWFLILCGVFLISAGISYELNLQVYPVISGSLGDLK